MSLDWSIQLAVKPASWFTANPNHILKLGQKVYKDDQSGLYKIGDGTTILSSLNFLGASGGTYTGSNGISLVGSDFQFTSHAISQFTNDSGYITSSALSPYGLLANPLSQFAATTSAQLAGVISDETGSGALVFATSPSLVTPNIGVATGTSLIVGGGTNIGFDLAVIKSSNAIIGAKTTSTTGYAELFLQADNPVKYWGSYFVGSAVTPSGLALANSLLWEVYAETFLIQNVVGTMVFSKGTLAADESMRISTTQNISISGKAATKVTSPTAYLHLAKAIGGATTNSASLKFESATALLNTPEIGAIEFLNDAWYGTITTGSVRKTFAFLESPIFTTDITTPVIYGGTAVGSAINLIGTSGVGTSTVAAINFKVGSNGGTTAASIFNSGAFNIGNAANNTTSNGILRVGQGASWVDIGEVSSAATIWFSVASPASNNYGFRGSSSSVVLNASSSVSMYIGTGDGLTLYTNRYTFNCNTAATTGAITTYLFQPPANTGQTASTNIPTFKVTGNTKTWAAGTVALQYFSYFSANTVDANSASTFTHVSNFRSDAPLQGTNATATNLYAIDCGGHMFIANSVGVPSNNPTGGGILYVESGALKYRGSSGTVTTLGAA